LITPKGIIEKEYIERFLKVKKVSYADIGIRVRDINSKVIVSSSNPFMKNNPFKKDDIILEFDDKKVKESATFMRNVLFSKIGSIHKVKVQRDSKILTLSVKSKKRHGGGFLSDTFLELLGISFDKNSRISKIEEKALKYQLRVGDKLIQINGVKIDNIDGVLEILAQSRKSLNLLFQRDEFQFFVNIN
jgi:S1-C subfamily serine protease